MKQRSPAGKLIFVVGPTAAGKSQIAYKLAKRMGAEIISCDSMQVYRHMDIMNQVPPSRWTRSVQHYLMGCLEPEREYSAAQFREQALELIERVMKKGKLPLIVGGSGLYMKALLDGLFPLPKKDEKLRENLRKEAESKGSRSLYDELKRIDNESASRIHPNDLRRIIRALEVYYLTGLPISRHKEMTKGITSDYDIKIFGITRPREILYKRINDRVDGMFKKGLVKEVKKLSRKKLSVTAKASLGYKEITGYLKGEYDLEKARDLLKQNTRRLAKKQLTWFRADGRIKWLDADKADNIEEIIVTIIWNKRY